MIERGHTDWKDVLGTWTMEGNWDKDNKGYNNNGTTDHGVVQLNSAYHSKFINSPEFQDAYKQVDYAIEVLEDAKKKNRPIGKVWYAWPKRHTAISNLECV